MTGLRLTQPRTAPSRSSAQSTLKFPVQAVRELPDWAHRPSGGLRLRTPEEVEATSPGCDVIRQAELTLARMQANIDEIQRDARDTLLWPLQAAVDGSSYDRPRAA